MKLVNHLYSNEKDLSLFLDDNKITDKPNILVQVFSGIIEETHLREVSKSISQILPSATIVGATTGGEIIDGKVTDNQTILSISVFEHTQIKSHFISKADSYITGEMIANEIVQEDTQVLILFSDGFFTLPNDLFNGVKSVNEDILIAGGMAGDNGLLQNTLVLLNGDVSNHAVAAISLNSDQLTVSNYYKLNWRSVGKKMKVTQAQGNMVHTIDSMKVKDLYRKYLGDDIADGLPHTAALYPLVKVKEGLDVSRILFSFNDDGSANYTGNMIEGEDVQFAYANVDMIMDNSYLSKSNVEAYEAAYIYSCMSRKIILKEHTDIETKPIADKIAMSGFFTYGEFYTLENKSSEVLNETMTMLFLSENEILKNELDNDSQNSNQTTTAVSSSDMIVKAISHLSDVTSREVEQQKEELAEKNKLIHDSINYASLIQGALTPESSVFNNYFEDSFVIWQPKDIVGGDIYLASELSSDEILLMVIDCTGHGVPGAFVTMLVKAIERQLVSRIINTNEEVSTSKILSIFNKSVKHLLKQDNPDTTSNAGFDGGILYYNKSEKLIKYSGAETPLFIVYGEELKMIKGDRHSIGYKKSDTDYQFKEHSIEVTEGMKLYITTDGYIDQNGGDKGFPFGKKRFKQLVFDNHQEKMADQKEMLLYELDNYQGNSERNDDVTVVGIKF
ncbi:MAG: SpoIIE family protein phosphatase [Gammaproteobacteria bacterium]|nr:SpoIIE family protein phosphatase [Gammaproteobacteria bacterium]